MKNSFKIQFDTFSSYEQFLRDAIGHRGVVVADWEPNDNSVRIGNKTHRSALKQLLNKNKNWTINANDNKRSCKTSRNTRSRAA